MFLKCDNHYSTSLLRYAQSWRHSYQSYYSAPRPSSCTKTACRSWRRKCLKNSNSSWAARRSMGGWRNTICRLGNLTNISPWQWVSKKRIFDVLQHVLRVRVWFKKVVGIVNPIANMDRMVLHRNEISSQKTLTIRDKDRVVKENHHLTRERIACLTVLPSQYVPVPPQFVFKGKGTYLQNKLKLPTGVTTLGSVKGSYRVDTIIEITKRLPDNTNLGCMSGRTYIMWQLVVSFRICH